MSIDSQVSKKQMEAKEVQYGKVIYENNRRGPGKPVINYAGKSKATE